MREHARACASDKHPQAWGPRICSSYADWSIPLLQLLRRRNGDIFKSNFTTNLFLTTNLSADCFSPPGGKVNMRYRDKPEREGLTAVEKHTSLARENVCRWNSSINNWKYSAFVAGGEVCDSGSMAGLVAAALGADGKLKPKINPGRYKN